PVTDQMRLRVTPGAPDRAISIALFDLMGHRVKQLFDGLPSSSLEFDLTWDRRVPSGGRAAPGFYYLKIKGGGTNELRTIYLAP
ncbi:MAG: hypothetical protein U0527_17700, partial [Candidatus Eisenbacteria bacterium]